MATQYDDIGQRYKGLSDLPAQAIERPSILNVLGDVKGLKCLDLACGLGRWSHFLVDQGAAHVVGVDISESMVLEAQKSISSLSLVEQAKFKFIAKDCGKPLILEEGPFDVVLAVWFLNYASSYDELLAMWRNIHNNLKPGGRFIGLTSNTFTGLGEPIDDRYGIGVIPLGRTSEGGWRCRIVAHTHPEKVEFDNYHQPHGVYERAATEAGFPGVTWRSHTLPEDERKNSGYWDVFNFHPHFSLCLATRTTSQTDSANLQGHTKMSS